jgi:hypothetical protein
MTGMSHIRPNVSYQICVQSAAMKSESVNLPHTEHPQAYLRHKMIRHVWVWDAGQSFQHGVQALRRQYVIQSASSSS